MPFNDLCHDLHKMQIVASVGNQLLTLVEAEMDSIYAEQKYFIQLANRLKDETISEKQYFL